MEVLIVARTKWGDYYCISAIEMATNKFIRLMTSFGGYQPNNTQYKVGQVWDVDYTCLRVRPPHIEDVRVTSQKYLRENLDIKTYILKNCQIWTGSPKKLFDSKLKWDNGSGYLNDATDLPQNSVGFWSCHKDLVLDNYKKYYNYKSRIPLNNKRLPYKGIEPPLAIIPAETLIRVSLAKWWKKDNGTEERCYLQLSGWYS